MTLEDPTLHVTDLSEQEVLGQAVALIRQCAVCGPDQRDVQPMLDTLALLPESVLRPVIAALVALATPAWESLAESAGVDVGVLLDKTVRKITSL